MKYSALVLTHNEEHHIAACLQSLHGAQRIVVIDSGSTDGTTRIVRAAGSRVELIERPFHSFSDQRNFGLSDAFKPGEWVLHLDADERVPHNLERELWSLDAPADAVAYNIASLVYFRDRAIPRASGYPNYQTRLTRSGAFRFVEVGHGQKAPPGLGELPRLRSPYGHYPLEKGLGEWFARHNRYSDREARQWLAGEKEPHQYTLGTALRDPIARRQYLKRLSRRLPARPWWIYLWMMIARGGILDGAPGRDYCRLRFLYESMIDIRLRELRAEGWDVEAFGTAEPVDSSSRSVEQ